MKLIKKAQSATEYLMTYGWALLAIAIVGGLLYMYVFSNKECTEVTKGWSQQGVVIVPNEYQVMTDGSISMIVKNNLDKSVNITKIDVDGNICDFTSSPIILAPGQTQQLSTSTYSCLKTNPRNENSCEQINIKFTYNVEGGLSNKVSSGSIIAKVIAP